MAYKFSFPAFRTTSHGPCIQPLALKAMTSLQSEQITAIIALNTLGSYCGITGTVVFLYDSVLTAPEEIRCFWGRKVTGGAIIFWLNKYITMLSLCWAIGSDFLKISDTRSVNCRHISSV
ncbi:hypothetical protein BD309DRAFT_342296 [Dichomitus squalens]|nr:hypothetical protein BD309DRAFT_342296 [Dichomitus squalens]